MAIKFSFKYISLLFFCLIIIGCKKEFENNKASSSQIGNKKNELIQIANAERVIKNFYLTYYDTEVLNELRNTHLKKFVTKKLFNKIQALRSPNNLILNYDPFIKAQDYDFDIIKNTLKVENYSLGESEYKVSFNLFEIHGDIF